MIKKGPFSYITRLITVLEVLLALFLIVGVVISIPDLVKYFMKILSSPADISYDMFQQYLSHVLLLVIGLELTSMMMIHTDTSIIYLVIMVIARKMLIYAHTSLDLLMDVMAIFLLFAMKKYFMVKPTADKLDRAIFSATVEIDAINERFKEEIEDMGFDTIGGLVSFLLSQSKLVPAKGVVIDDKDYIYSIEKEKNGIIEEIMVQKK